MDMDDLVETIKDAFEDMGVSIGKNPDQLFKRCALLSEKYHVLPDDFVGAWLAFAATNGVDELDEKGLEELEKRDLSSRKATTKKTQAASVLTAVNPDAKIHVYGGSPTLGGGDSDVEMDVKEENDPDNLWALYGGIAAPASTKAATPKAAKSSVNRLRSTAGETPKSGFGFSPKGYSPAVTSKSESYGARTMNGDAVLRYKCKDSSYWDDRSDSRLPVKPFPFKFTKNLIDEQASFKYMFQNTTDVASILNIPIEDIILETDKELEDLRVSSGLQSWYLGKIRSDEGRLSQRSAYLEGDRDISGGHVVPLDLSNADEYRLFPGQVVFIKGENELGQCLRASEIVVPAPKPQSLILPGTTRPLNIIIACGPFTPSDSLQYEPLEDLIAVVKRDKPDICILLGPFIDPSHPMIEDVATAFDDWFEALISKIKESVEELDTHLVIASSSRDVHHDPVYPTPPYSLKYVSKITSLPDPAIFEVAGITIGVTSTDILKHMGNGEIAKSTIMDRMGGLSKLILSQRNFYPLYPPDESVPFDVQLWSKYCRFEKTPHILILPSDLRYFIKDIDGVIVVNSERLAKGKSGGTYVRLQVKLPEHIEENMTSVADFCCGEIIKI